MTKRLVGPIATVGRAGTMRKCAKQAHESAKPKARVGLLTVTQRSAMHEAVLYCMRQPSDSAFVLVSLEMIAARHVDHGNNK